MGLHIGYKCKCQQNLICNHADRLQLVHEPCGYVFPQDVQDEVSQMLWVIKSDSSHGPGE